MRTFECQYCAKVVKYYNRNIHWRSQACFRARVQHEKLTQAFAPVKCCVPCCVLCKASTEDLLLSTGYRLNEDQRLKALKLWRGEMTILEIVEIVVGVL